MDFDVFVSVDWGTTSLRVRLVDWETRRILSEVRSSDGVAQVSGDDRVRVLDGILAKAVLSVLDSGGMSGAVLPVVISGMAGSTLGLRALPYARLPWPLDGGGALSERVSVAGLEGYPVTLYSGVAADRDVMRGEETELMGLAALVDFGSDAVVVMPGTHCKHVRIREGAITNFSTYMTGELYWLLAKQGTLARAVDVDAMSLDDAQVRDAFVAGVTNSERLAVTNGMFQVRAASVLGVRSGAEGAAELLGLLIGAELSELACGDHGGAVWIAAGDWWERFYRVGGEAVGLQCNCIPSETLANALVAAHCRLAGRR